MDRKQVDVTGKRASIERPARPLVARPGGRGKPSAPLDEAARAARIREVAYRLYEARGHEDGHDLEDWLAAEAALAAESAR